MKKLFIFLIAIAISVPLMAQKSSDLFEELTNKYADKDGFSASQISKDMFDLYLKKRNIEEDSPVAEALKNLENILVISQNTSSRAAALVANGYIKAEDAEDEKTDKENELHNEILNYYKQGNYTLLKTEKRMGEDVKVYLKKNNDKIESLALITNSTFSTNLIELKGDDINLKTVSDLSGALNLRGLENLYKINNSSRSSFGLATGQYSSGKSYWPGVEILNNQKEWAKQFEMTEEQKAEFEKQAKIMAEKQAEMAEKYKAIAEKNFKLNEEQMIKLEQQARELAAKEMERAKKYQEMAEIYGRSPIFLSAPGDTNTVYYLDGKKVKAKKIKELNKSEIESIEYKKGEKEGDKTKIYFKTK